MKIIILFLFFVLLASSVNANLIVSRESVSSINYGDNLEIEISVLNNFTSDEDIIIIEQVQDAKLISPRYPNYNLSRNQISYFKWQFSVPAGEIIVVNYTIRPLRIGEYSSAPTRVVVGNENYYGGVLSIRVSCIVDGVCSKGENFLNCADCESGREDGICDNLVDGRCDPDCTFDLDCEEKELGFWNKIKLFFSSLF